MELASIFGTIKGNPLAGLITTGAKLISILLLIGVGAYIIYLS
jgi:putative Mn2+ efflux pump MntP